MRAIVHIGTEKTGTTSAQRWFGNNRKFLQSQGIAYPKSLGGSVHWKLATLARDSDRPERGFRMLGIEDPAAHGSFREELEAAFAAEVQASDAAVCLISSEQLYDRVERSAEVARLKALLDRRFDDHMVVAWVRPQVDYALSFASTFARQGRAFDRKVLGHVLNYKKCRYEMRFRVWEDVFGDRLTLYPYKSNPNVVATLVDLCGGSMDGAPPIRRENSKLGVRVIQMSNDIELPTPKKKSDPGWRRKRFLDAIVSDPPLKISQQEAQALHKPFEAANAVLASRHRLLSEVDLAPDWDKFDEESNIGVLDEHAPFPTELRQLVQFFDIELKHRAVEIALLEAELALARGGNPKRKVKSAKRAVGALRAVTEMFEGRCPKDRVDIAEEKVAELAAQVGVSDDSTG